MNPLTVNPAIILQHTRQVREAEMRTTRRHAAGKRFSISSKNASASRA